jgi:hypothetical protein
VRSEVQLFPDPPLSRLPALKSLSFTKVNFVRLRLASHESRFVDQLRTRKQAETQHEPSRTWRSLKMSLRRRDVERTSAVGRAKRAASAIVSSRIDQRRGCSSAGRAPALQAGGHRFDPGQLHQLRHGIRKEGVTRRYAFFSDPLRD